MEVGENGNSHVAQFFLSESYAVLLARFEACSSRHNSCISA